jgi:hypothetical protein
MGKQLSKFTLYSVCVVLVTQSLIANISIITGTAGAMNSQLPLGRGHIHFAL